MKRHLGLSSMLLLACFALWGQNSFLNTQFTPHYIFVNSLKSSSLDPEAAWAQPILTMLQISNVSTTSFRFYLKVDISWSGASEPQLTGICLSEQELPAGGTFAALTNQDLLNSVPPAGFAAVGDWDFSLDHMTEGTTVLKNAVQAGFFPAGSMSVKASLQPEAMGYTDWSQASTSTFTIYVRSAGVIQLLSPGAPIGVNPPVISDNPVDFLWNAIDTGVNDYQITIREYPANLPPQPGSLANTGSVFYDHATGGGVDQYSFSRFLPFVPGNYYAWRISTTQFTEFHPTGGGGIWRDDDPGLIASDWYVFRYDSTELETDIPQRINALLNSLDNPELRKLLDSGFFPTGSVLWQGKQYSGQAALDLLELLKGKDCKVRVWE